MSTVTLPMHPGIMVIVGCDIRHCIEGSTGRTLGELVRSGEDEVGPPPADRLGEQAAALHLQAFTLRGAGEGDTDTPDQMLGLMLRFTESSAGHMVQDPVHGTGTAHASGHGLVHGPATGLTGGEGTGGGRETGGGYGFPAVTDLAAIMNHAETVRSYLASGGFQGPVGVLPLWGTLSGSTVEIPPAPPPIRTMVGFDVMRTLVTTRRGTKTLYRALRDGDLGSFDGHTLQMGQTRLELLTCADGTPARSGIEMYLGLTVPDGGSGEQEHDSTRIPGIPPPLSPGTMASLGDEASRLAQGLGITDRPRVCFIPVFPGTRLTDARGGELDLPGGEGGEQGNLEAPGHPRFRFHDPATLDLLQLRIRSLLGHGGTPHGQTPGGREDSVPVMEPEIVYQPGDPNRGWGGNHGMGAPGGTPVVRVTAGGRTFTGIPRRGRAGDLMMFLQYVNQAEMAKRLWTLFIFAFVLSVLVDTGRFLQSPFDIMADSLVFLSPFIIFYLHTRSRILSGASRHGGPPGPHDSMRLHGESYWLFSWCCLFATFGALRLVVIFAGLEDMYIFFWIFLLLAWFRFLGKRTMVLYYNLFVARR